MNLEIVRGIKPDQDNLEGPISKPSTEATTSVRHQRRFDGMDDKQNFEGFLTFALLIVLIAGAIKFKVGACVE